MDPEVIAEFTDRLDNIVAAVEKLAKKPAHAITVEAPAPTIIPPSSVQVTVQERESKSWKVGDIVRDSEGRLREFTITCQD